MSIACCKISNMSAVYDPLRFAEWLTSAFRDSPYKSWQEVADRVDTSRATLSRYARAAEQSLTNKPSQPGPQLVIKLAELFGKDVDKALQIAGHAPRSGGIEEGLFSGFNNLSPRMQKLAQQQIRAIIESLAAQDEHDTDYIDTKE